MIFVFDFNRLPQKEQDRVEEILAKSLKKERGEPVEDLIPVEDEEESDEGKPIQYCAFDILWKDVFHLVFYSE